MQVEGLGNCKVEEPYYEKGKASIMGVFAQSGHLKDNDDDLGMERRQLEQQAIDQPDESSRIATICILIVVLAVVLAVILRVRLQRFARKYRQVLRQFFSNRTDMDHISIEELQEIEEALAQYPLVPHEVLKRLQNQSRGELVQILLLCAFHGLSNTTREVAALLRSEEDELSSHLNNALLIASSNGRVNVVQELLLRKLADANARSSHHNSALILASTKGHTDVVKLLMDTTFHVDVNQANSFQVTALASASEQGFNDIVDTLLQRPDVDPSINFNLAVRRAAQRRHDRIVLKLLETSPRAELALAPVDIDAAPLLRYLHCAALDNTRRVWHIMNADDFADLPRSIRAKIMGMAFGLGVVLIGPNRRFPDILFESLADASHTHELPSNARFTSTHLA